LCLGLENGQRRLLAPNCCLLGVVSFAGLQRYVQIVEDGNSLMALDPNIDAAMRYVADMTFVGG
jgi:hypothetical protein